MKLTESQIQELYTFTRAHFVEHYDLQTELVDHLANDIEQMWQIEPKLLFEDAKNRAFKKFGIFGFMDAISAKAKAMNKRYLKYFWKELKKWFEIPQIVMTIGIFVLFYSVFSTPYVFRFIIIFFIMIGIWCTFKGIQLKRQFKKRKQLSGKKWLMEEMIFKQATGTSLVIVSNFINLINFSKLLSENIYAVIGLSILFTFLVILNYISFELIPNKAEDLLNETYPEFSL